MRLTKEKIEELLRNEKPGFASHAKMTPQHRQADMASFDVKNARKSAVMIILYHEADDLKVTLIRRGKYVGIHSGQIAFPGGRYEDTDMHVRNTAIREIEEEIGLKAHEYDIVGRLTDIYVPPSSFIVSVFVAYMRQKPVFRIDPREVDEVLTFSMREFLQAGAIGERVFFVQSANISTAAPCYLLNGVEIWGASAMVMTELIDVLYPENSTQANGQVLECNIYKKNVV